MGYRSAPLRGHTTKGAGRQSDGFAGGTLMAAKLRGPGFYRAGWMMVIAVGFATLITWLVRMSTGHATVRTRGGTTSASTPTTR